MKDETLKEFRKKFTAYVDAVDSNFSEIDKLKADIKGLQEGSDKKGKEARLKELERIREDYVYREANCRHYNYTSKDYAIFATRPIVEQEDEYNIFLRIGPREVSEINRHCDINEGLIYIYQNIETFHLIDVKVEDSEEFEKTHQIIDIESCEHSDEFLRLQFFIGCATNDPNEVVKQMIKKYGKCNGQRD